MALITDTLNAKGEELNTKFNIVLDKETNKYAVTSPDALSASEFRKVLDRFLQSPDDPRHDWIPKKFGVSVREFVAMNMKLLEKYK